MKAKTFILAFMSVFLLSGSILKKPKWIEFENRTVLFPENIYYTGFSSDENREGEKVEAFLEKLVSYSKKLLIESIQVTIKSMSTIKIENLNEDTHEHFKQSSTSTSDLNLAGLHTQKYYDHRKKTGYALCYVKKTEMIQLYQNMVDVKLQNIYEKIDNGYNFITSDNKQAALKSFFNCLPTIREIESAQSVMIAMGQTDNDKLKIKELNDVRKRVNYYIENLQTSEQKNLDDICFSISFGLKMQTGELNQSIYLQNFTYQDTEMGSDFSNRLIHTLESKLSNIAGFSIFTGPYKLNENNDLGHLEITGTYWEENNRIKIISLFKNMDTGNTLASTENYMPTDWLTGNNVDLKPSNYGFALEEIQAFNKDKSDFSGLYAEVWTNKGNKNLVFQEGDTLKLYIRTNKECYARCIYHQADGTKVLLLDNYHVGQIHVNRIIELPYYFQCTPPFGAEILQFNAQSRPFPPLTVQYGNGYTFIMENLEQIVSNVRGFKVSSNDDVAAEKRLIITTTERSFIE